MSIHKPWGGRFSQPTDQMVERFTQSVDHDRRLYKHDIRGSIAHARMLAKVGVLTKEESGAIEAGLREIQAEIEAGVFNWSVGLEDVHMNIETALIQKIGKAGKKLHTGRSRNDQVATDMRLYLRDAVDELIQLLHQLQTVLLDLAEGETGTLMPGLTHLQVAQPVTLGHHVMAWFEMFDRDKDRFAECRRRINVLPLGAAALAGTSFPIDRVFTAKDLGFDAICANSLDAVSDRDFAIEFCSHAALLAAHMSRVAEELIIWASDRYQYIEIGDAFCTGSSIMPQKKNPDVAELIRGKSGTVIGNLVATLVIIKSQPLAYNRDNQEDKAPLFATVDAVQESVRVLAAMIPTIEIKPTSMRRALESGFATATDLAEYLVRRAVPFRDAHEVVGKTVRFCIDNEVHLSQLSLDQLRQFSPLIEDDVFAVISLEGSVRARAHPGGTAPEQVKVAVAKARNRLVSFAGNRGSSKAG